MNMLILIAVMLAILRYGILRRKRRTNVNSSPSSFGFLHPHALSGGGGERVLWTAVLATWQQFPTARLVLYSVWSGRTSREAVEEAKRRSRSHFGIDLADLEFEAVDISDVANLVDPLRYPHFTLVLQACGAVVLGFLAYLRKPTDIIIDTANLAFALVAPRVLNAHTITYVHYPTISADMLTTVARRETGVHNNEATARSPVRTAAKLIYYHAFALLYAGAARFIDKAIANSSWTAAHLQRVWGREVPVIFPPCKVPPSKEYQPEEHEDKRQDKLILSVAQFRPEKRHDEQLAIMKRVVAEVADVNLIMIGGARDDRDVQRAAGIRKRAEDLKLPVDIRLNVSREEMAECLRTATVGLHTMRYEHFGIGVVELMIAGVIVVAHRSGGVESDIIQDGENGFLAEDETQFVESVHRVLQMRQTERRRLCEKAIISCTKFSEQAFCAKFTNLLETMVVRPG